MFLKKRICVLITIDQNVKLILQTWLYENFNKRKSINRLIDAFLKKKSKHYRIMNVYLIFEFRKVRNLNVNQNLKSFVIHKKYVLSSNLREFVIQKRNMIVIESINSWLVDSIDIRLRTQWITRYVASNVVLTRIN